MNKKLQIFLQLFTFLLLFSCSSEKQEYNLEIAPHSIYEFSFEKSQDTTLTPRMEAFLEEAAIMMQSNDKFVIFITGHADNSAPKEKSFSKAYSRIRCASKYLKAKGISDDRMKIFNKGDSEPISETSTEKGRALNRRLEFKITF